MSQKTVELLISLQGCSAYRDGFTGGIPGLEW